MAAYDIRLVVAGDHASIYSDWLRSARKARTYAGITSQVFFFWMHLTIEQLLGDPTCTWAVACSKDDPTKIYGWLCGQRADTLAGDQAVVHYVYVKKLYRRMGFGTALFDSFVGKAPVVVATSMSDSGKVFVPGAVVFNPFLLFARVPVVVPRPRKNSPVAVSRRRLAEGGFVPEDEGE